MANTPRPPERKLLPLYAQRKHKPTANKATACLPKVTHEVRARAFRQRRVPTEHDVSKLGSLQTDGESVNVLVTQKLAST